MTSRERLLATVVGREVDRIAWTPELNAHFVERTLQTKGVDPASVPHVYAAGCKAVGADTLTSAQAWKETHPGVHITSKQDGSYIHTSYETPVGTLTTTSEERGDAKTTYRVEHMLKGPETFNAYRYWYEGADYEEDFEAVEQVRKALREDGLASLNAPVTPLMHFIMFDMGIERTLYNIHDHEQEMVELMAAMHEQNKEVYEIVARAPGEIVRPFEDTSTSLTSPAMYAKYCIPYLDEYADIVHKGGKKYIVHMCGLLKDMLPLLAQTKIDGIEAATPPPTGDAPASLIREVMGDERVIIGGLDATLFTWMEPAQVEDMVGQVLDSVAPGRRFALGSEEMSYHARLESVERVAEVIRARAEAGLR